MRIRGQEMLFFMEHFAYVLNEWSPNRFPKSLKCTGLVGPCSYDRFAASETDLSKTFDCVPHDFWLTL